MSDTVKKTKSNKRKKSQDVQNPKPEQVEKIENGVQEKQAPASTSENSSKKKKYNNKKNSQTEAVKESLTQETSNSSPTEEKTAVAVANVEPAKEVSEQANKDVVPAETKPKKKKKKSKAKNTESSEKNTENATEPKESQVSKAADQEESQFRVCQVKLYVTMPPCFTGDLNAGVNELLNCYVFKYMSQFDGIVLTHSNTKQLQSHGLIMYDSPFVNFWITTQFLVWRPKIGTRITGTIQLQNADFVGLLLFGTFNAVITANELPSSYEWKGESSYEGEWVDKTSGESLANSSSLSFFVKSFSPSQDTLTIMGTLKE